MSVKYQNILWKMVRSGVPLNTKVSKDTMLDLIIENWDNFSESLKTCITNNLMECCENE